MKSSGQTHKDSNLNQLGVTKEPPESCYDPAPKLAESRRRCRDPGGRTEPSRHSALSVLTNELANGALAVFFAVTGEMWPCKITSNPRLMQAVTAASNCDLSHLGNQTVWWKGWTLSSPLLRCFYTGKTVQLIIRDVRKITLIHIINMYVSRNGKCF